MLTSVGKAQPFGPRTSLCGGRVPRRVFHLGVEQAQETGTGHGPGRKKVARGWARGLGG